MTIQGKVLIDKSIPSFSGATLYIYLQDVGRIDAKADNLHKETLQNISHSQGKDSQIEFRFDSAESRKPNPRYNLRAHIDKSGNGEVEEGDLVTTQSYPVDPSDLEVYEPKVKEV